MNSNKNNSAESNDSIKADDNIQQGDNPKTSFFSKKPETAKGKKNGQKKKIEKPSALEQQILDKFSHKEKKTLKAVNPTPIFSINAEKAEIHEKETAIPAEPKIKRRILTPARLIALGMVALIFLGTFLLALPVSSKSREWMGFSDALFTSCSAVCVTGLIVVDTAAYFSIFGQVVLLLLMQVGGLGFMTAATLIFLIIRKKITFKNRLAMQEALNQESSGGTVRLMKHVLIFTFIIEGAGALLLMPFMIIEHGAAGIFNSVFLSVSAFCNAGFENIGASVHPFTGTTSYGGNTVVMLTISLLTILGGVGFFVIGDVIRNKRLSKFSIHTKLVLLSTSILFAVSVMFFMVSEYDNPETIGSMNFGNKLVNAVFHSASARTSGFTVLEQKKMHLSSQLFTMILMFIGASPASCGGGIKTTTVSILILMFIAGFRGTDEITFNKKTLTRRAGFRAVSVLLFALTLILFLTMMLMLTEKNNPAMVPYYNLTDMLYESVSAFSTTGLSMGITANLTEAGRVLIMLTMFLGRVGPITIGLMFLNRAGRAQVKYPEANIMIG